MNECEKYRSNIEGILRKSDLSTITTKKVRQALESELGISLGHIKKEINVFIEQLFLDFQEQSEQPIKIEDVKQEDVKQDYTKVVKQEPSIKKVKDKPKKVEKKSTNATEPKEKRKINWPLLKVRPPLSDIIKTEVCSRPQTVKKLWEYIKEHNLQDSADKRIIICDAKFKALCDNEEKITAFNMNKYIQKYFETIPKEEQEKYKQMLKEEEEQDSVTIKTEE